jgi:hypothetical protein
MSNAIVVVNTANALLTLSDGNVEEESLKNLLGEACTLQKKLKATLNSIFTHCERLGIDNSTGFLDNEEVASELRDSTFLDDMMRLAMNSSDEREDLDMDMVLKEL